MATKEMKVVDLQLITKKEMKELETVKGKMYRVGEYTFRFTENGLEKRATPKPQAKHTRLATTDNGWSKCNMAPDEKLHVYMRIPPEAYHGDSQEAAEQIFMQAGELASDIAKIDFRPLVAAMRAFFKEMVEAYNKQTKG